jgi:glucosamine-6-phosphate deaminase
MEVVIAGSPDEVAQLAAGIVIRVVSTTSRPVIGLATGNSPLGTYRLLIERHRSAGLSFAGASAVTLDEYVGLPHGHPQSYRSVIRAEFVDHVDLPIERLHSPSVHTADLAAACDAYDRTVIDLGVDVQLLGIGTDGHIGFNEPGSSLSSRTRIKTLTDRTRSDNARFFGSIDEVPRHVVTQGLGTIAAATHLVLIATGAHKAAPIAAMVEGPVSASCPASVLQLHRHVTVLLDDAAARELRHSAYYRETYRHKPSWQYF